MKCPKCGVAVSFWRLSTSTLCDVCAESQKEEKEQQKLEKEQQKLEELQAGERRLTAIRRGEGTAEDLAHLTEEECRKLAPEGWLIVAGRLISCPICRCDRFSQRRALLSSRADAAFNMQWLSDSAEAWICRQCGYILWFMR